MKYRKLVSFVLALSICLIGVSGCSQDVTSPNNDSGSDDHVVVGILQYEENDQLNAAREGFLAKLKELGYDGTKIKFQIKFAQGKANTADLIAKQFVSDRVDLIYALATPAAQAAYHATMKTEVPLIFNAVSEPLKAGIVKSLESPVGNVTGVCDAKLVEAQFKLMRELLPKAKTIGILYDLEEANSQQQIEQLKDLSDTYGFEIQAYGISSAIEVSTAAEQLSETVDCFYAIDDLMITNAIASLVEVSNEKQLALFGTEESLLAKGMIAIEVLDYFSLGEQAGQMAYELLINGKEPSELPIETAKSSVLMINEAVAKALDIEIPPALYQRATFFKE